MSKLYVEPYRLSENTVIRKAVKEDLVGIMGLFGCMHPEDGLVNYEKILEVFEQIELDSRRVILVAEESSKGIIGTIDFFYVPNLTREARPWGGVENLVVHPDERRQGIGGALIQTVVNLAKAVDCYKIQLVSHNSRVEAHRLYDEMGFSAPVRGYRYYL